jgi:23S rRNA-/tRNA-specific pseudouridylate synthase
LAQWVQARVGAEWFNVHRLDRETSGVVLFGYGREMVAALAGRFDSRLVTKVYEALVHGRPARSRGAISTPLAADPRRPGKMIVDPSGSPARTQYETRRTWPGVQRGAGVPPALCVPLAWPLENDKSTSPPDAGRMPARRAGETPSPRAAGQTPVPAAGVSLLELWPLTGRTHQLRVHLASIGCPILADPFYGAGDADHDIIPRLALHARRLTLTHPATDHPLTIESPRPQAFEVAMAKLGAS